jgi:hypothetical protein
VDEIHMTGAIAANDTVVTDPPSWEHSPSSGFDGGTYIGGIVVVAKVKEGKRAGVWPVVVPCVAVEALTEGEEAAKGSSAAW